MPFEFPMRGEVSTLTPALRREIGGSYIALPDGITHYQLAGPDDGRLIVMLHGFSVPNFVWGPTFDALAQAGYRVLRFDFFGRGYSDRPYLAYDLDLFTHQLVDLLNGLEIETCRAVLGLSMGGVVASDFAVKHTERLEKLGLFAPAGFPLDLPKIIRLLILPGLGELIFSVLSEKRFEQIVGNSIFDPAEVALVIDRYSPQMRIKGFRRAILSTMRHRVAEQGVEIYQALGKITDLPVFLVWGEDDPTVPFKFSSVFRSMVPQAEFHPVAGGGHIPHYRQSEQVTPLILEFLNGKE
jgi:pimeloyl-ACP methyl ester carboxylesterase